MQAGTDVKFKVGDKAVYPAQGVAEVIKIEEKDIAGTRQRFYVLRILDTDRKIMVPVSNASAVGLRQVISEQEIREIFDILRERTIAFDNQTWNRRYRGFMDKIKTGSIYDVAEVLRDLYRLKTDKQLSFGERRMLDTARTLIVKEIAIARAQTEENVRNEIEKNRTKLEAWEALCRDLREEPANVALAWLLHNKVVTAPIIGPRTLEQLDGSLRALEIELSPETLAKLDEIFPGYRPAPEGYAW